MKKIIYTRPDGGLSVVHPVLNTLGEEDGFTEEQVFDRALDKIPTDASNVRIVDESDIPTDRTFRNAWVDTGTLVDHDMAKCREIHKNKLRNWRTPKLLALDIDYQRADEAGDAVKKKQIASEKQLLRDITKNPAIASANTVEELLALESK
jgi:hypothetical protein